jgi:hypothetical protein
MTQTIIHSNGGGRTLPIEALFARLASHTLDRTFEAYGDFIQNALINERGEQLGPPGAVGFFGNFFDYSHVFNIWTDDADLIARLSAAVAANKASAAYRAQPPAFDSRKLGIVEHKFSETQGEVELIYDGRRLEQFGETYTISGQGRWVGRGVAFWQNAARRWLADEHYASLDDATKAVAPAQSKVA